jgi:hypothetical protein
MFISKYIHLIIVLVFILFCNAVTIKQGTGDLIILRDEKINFIPHQFFVAGVLDERSDTGSVASLIEKRADHSSVIKQADLKGGAAASIRNFISRNLGRDTALHAILIGIKEFKITETESPDGRITGRLAIVFSFSLGMGNRAVHLVDYSAGMRYNRPGDRPMDIEPVLRHGLEDVLSYFNTWINGQAQSNALLARKVMVRFSDYTEKPEGDTIYYRADRPLTWDDFRDKPRVGNYEAEVFTTIGYAERNEVIKGIIYVNMTIKVSVAKSDCWVQSGGRDEYILNHEQRHFDIEKIVSEHFKQRIAAMDLPVDNFYGPINVEYLETLREATRMQREYDLQTRHGQDRGAQQQWNERIDRELKEFGVKN